VLTLLPAVLAGQRPGLELVEFLPGVALAFEVEPLGLLFGLVASGLWIVTALYGIGYLRGLREQHQTRFHACFALAISGALGLAFSRNLATLFLFYEAITFSTYPLVTHHGTPEAVRAGRVYLGILVGTSVTFFLLAILWTWRLSGCLEFQPGGFLAGTAGSLSRSCSRSTCLASERRPSCPSIAGFPPPWSLPRRSARFSTPWRW
jgi:multicomponent Na+:H+ antiporter subunit D